VTEFTKDRHGTRRADFEYDESVRTMRGILIGLVLSLVQWGGIAVAVLAAVSGFTT